MILPTPPSGPLCGLVYDGGVQFNLHTQGDNIYRPPAYQINDTVKCLTTNNYAVIKQMDIRENTIVYLIKYLNTEDLVEKEEHELSDVHQYHNHILQDDIEWLRDRQKVTVFFPSIMQQPLRGYLRNTNHQWAFYAGRTLQTARPIAIPNLNRNLAIYIADNKIVRDWKTKLHMRNLAANLQTEQHVIRRMQLLRTTEIQCLNPDYIQSHLQQQPLFPSSSVIASCRRAHVDASDLEDLTEPPNLKSHNHMCLNDKSIWDRAYLQEYLGLHEDTETWSYLTEEEYQTLRPIHGNALPSMAIATIKRDANGNPQRAKYRIVALGNLDPHKWTKQDCYAPVMSQLEF